MNTPWLLEGKVAIVTGAGKGIGAETAKQLADAGASVTLAARTASQIEAVAAEITAAGGSALALATDVSSGEQVGRLVDQTLSKFGRVDFLINNAAVSGPTYANAWEVDPDEWIKALEINIVGIYLPTRAVIPHMIKQGSGRIINVSSTLSEVPGTQKSAYCTAKAGINHFTRVLDQELIGTGVTINSFDPGAVRTEMLDSMAPGKDLQEALLSREPSEPAEDMVWLCGPETSMLSGQFVKWMDPSVRMGVGRQRILQGVQPWDAFKWGTLATSSS